MVLVTMPPFDHEPASGETTLMLLETWLTTQATLSDSGLTETGPSPTGTSVSNLGVDGVVTSNTDKDEFAVLTANKRVPSAESRIGLVCEGSKFAYAGEADCAPIGIIVTARTRNMTPVSVR